MVTGFGVPTIVERLASFAAGASYDDLSEQARDQLRIRVLDALACAIGAVDREPVRLIRAQVEEFDHAGRCSLAAPYTTAATRDQIAATVADLDQLEVADLTKLFAAVRLTTPAAARAKVAIS